MTLWKLMAADIRGMVPDRGHGKALYALSVLLKLLLYPRIQAVLLFRLSHFFYRWKLTPLAFWLQSLELLVAGAEIHPAAQIGPGFCLVHSSGIVIGDRANRRAFHLLSGRDGRRFGQRRWSADFGRLGQSQRGRENFGWHHSRRSRDYRSQRRAAQRCARLRRRGRHSRARGQNQRARNDNCLTIHENSSHLAHLPVAQRRPAAPASPRRAARHRSAFSHARPLETLRTLAARAEAIEPDFRHRDRARGAAVARPGAKLSAFLSRTGPRLAPFSARHHRRVGRAVVGSRRAKLFPARPHFARCQTHHRNRTKPQQNFAAAF